MSMWKMGRHKLRASFISFLTLTFLALVPARAVLAESILDTISRTGVLMTATSDDAQPFAFRDPDGRIVGFSIDIVKAIRDALERDLHRSIRVEFFIASRTAQIEEIERRQVNLACEYSAMTWPNQQRIDYTLPIFRDGVRILAYREKVSQITDIDRLHLGVVSGSDTARILRAKWPTTTLNVYPNAHAALQGLATGELDGIADIGVVLRSLLATTVRLPGLIVVPRGEALAYEAIGCMVPKDDSRWRDYVNGVIRNLLTGVEDYRGRYMEIYDRWFGRNAVIAYPIDERTAQFLADSSAWID